MPTFDSKQYVGTADVVGTNRGIEPHYHPDPEGSNPIFPQHTPAHENIPPYQDWL